MSHLTTALRPLNALLIAGLFFAVTSARADDTNQPAEKPPVHREHVQFRFSPAIAEILRMVDADVSAPIIKAYIKHSPAIYNLRGDEIVALKRRGVADDILTALIEHGGAVREKYAKRMEPKPPLASPAPMTAAWPQAWMPNPYLAYPTYAYASPPPSQGVVGAAISFNNSCATLVNGQAVYSGYYIPGYGIVW